MSVRLQKYLHRFYFHGGCYVEGVSKTRDFVLICSYIYEKQHGPHNVLGGGKCHCAYLCYLTAPSEQIQAAVIAGQRPGIRDIQGPQHLEVFAITCVEKCWNGDPEQRPTFAGESFDCVLSVGC